MFDNVWFSGEEALDCQPPGISCLSPLTPGFSSKVFMSIVDQPNRYKLTAYFILFFGSGLTIPFFAMRHQLLKK